MCAQLESVPAPPTNVHQDCICLNGGKPVDGLIYIDPCCKVHYAELRLPNPDVKRNLRDLLTEHSVH